MTTAEPALQPPAAAIVRPPREATASWPLVDRLGYWLCWAVGIGLCVIAVAIVVFMFVKGISYAAPEPVRRIALAGAAAGKALGRLPRPDRSGR